MSFQYLSEDQRTRYRRFLTDPSPADLERFFYLDAVALAEVAKKRGPHNRLGSAVQWGTVRMLGTFLADPRDVPHVAVEYVAEQLGVADPSCIKNYPDRLPTGESIPSDLPAGFDDEELCTSFPGRRQDAGECRGIEDCTIGLVTGRELTQQPADVRRVVRPRISAASYIWGVHARRSAFAVARRAYTSISIFIRGSARPQMSIVAAGRTSPK